MIKLDSDTSAEQSLLYWTVFEDVKDCHEGFAIFVLRLLSSLPTDKVPLSANGHMSMRNVHKPPPSRSFSFESSGRSLKPSLNVPTSASAMLSLPYRAVCLGLCGIILRCTVHEISLKNVLLTQFKVDLTSYWCNRHIDLNSHQLQSCWFEACCWVVFWHGGAVVCFPWEVFMVIKSLVKMIRGDLARC